MNKMYESKWTLCWEIKWGFLLKKYISFKKSRSCETDLVPTKRLTDSRIILRVSSTNKVCVIKKKFYKIFWNPFGARRDDLSLFWWFYWLKTRNDDLTIWPLKLRFFCFGSIATYNIRFVHGSIGSFGSLERRLNWIDPLICLVYIQIQRYIILYRLQRVREL